MQSNTRLTVRLAAVFVVLALVPVTKANPHPPTEEDLAAVEALNKRTYDWLPYSHIYQEVFAGWGRFLNFNRTKDVVHILTTTFARVQDQDEYKLLRRLDKLGTFEQEKCDLVQGEISELLEDYAILKANVVPFLKTSRAHHTSFCANAKPGEKTKSVPPPLREQLVTPATKDDVVMPDETDDTSTDDCDSACVNNELDLGFLAIGAGGQTERMLKSATFKKALRFVYKLDRQADDVERFPQALRKLVAMLEEAERQDDKLDEPLQRVRGEASALLSLCTPRGGSQCSRNELFDHFSNFFPDYRELARRGTMREYVEECLATMNLYCSYSHPW
jgi:hypothetical protein